MSVESLPLPALSMTNFKGQQFPEQRGMCEQQLLHYFLVLCVCLEDCSPSCNPGQCSRVRGDQRQHTTGVRCTSNICGCVTLSCSHSGLWQLERLCVLCVVFCCSWRGKGDVNENSLLKRDFSKSKRTHSMFSKLMDVLQEL